MTGSATHSPDALAGGAAEAAALPPRPSYLAVWALMLGIASLLFMGLAGVPALIVGIAALKRIGVPENRLTGAGMAIVGMGLGLTGMVILAITVFVVIPARRHAARVERNKLHLRAIHQGMTTYAIGNKTPTGDGYLPGLTQVGFVTHDPIPARIPPEHPWERPRLQYGSLTNGADPAYRFAMLLNGGFVTPEYLIAPGDASRTPAVKGANVAVKNYSYAALELGIGTSRRREWSETLNSSAVVFSDRNTGTTARPGSIWNDAPDWTGAVVMNEGSAAFIQHWDEASRRWTPVVRNTRYGRRHWGPPVNAEDDLFKDETGGNDALMITEP